MRTAAILVLVSITILAGCTPHREPLTRQQWIDITSHTFKNVSSGKVLSAGDRVLRLSDSPTYVKIYHTPTKMVGSRKYSQFFLIGGVFGKFTFDLTTTQQGTDVLAQLYISESTQPLMPVPTADAGGIGATAGTGVVTEGDPYEHKEAYDLFFSRIEAVLYGTRWIICKEASGDSRPLCLKADDKIPKDANLSQAGLKYLKRFKEAAEN